MTHDKCPCGKPAHPCYYFRCEDCWVDANVVRSPGHGLRHERRSRPPEAINPFLSEFERALFQGHNSRKFA